MSETNLRDISLFKGVDEQYVDEFLLSCKTINLKKDQYLFHKNEVGDSMYIVQDGKLQVLLDESSSGNNSQMEKIVSTLESGALIGELCVFGQLKRSASIRALVDSKLLKVEGEDFRIRIYSKELDALLICYNIAKVLSQRLFVADALLKP